MSTQATKKVLVLPDMHVPNHDSAALDAVLQYIEDESFDEFIQLGDFLDMDCLSGHNPDAILEREGSRYQLEIDAGSLVLDKLDKALSKGNPACRKVMLKGNHEWRADRYVEKNPALLDKISVARDLGLETRGYTYVECYPSGDLYQIGHAYFTHGVYCGSNHAKKHVDHFGVNLFYGHTHSVQTYSKQVHGKGTTIVGQSLGCMSLYDPPYMAGRPNDWQQAFAVFWFRPDGLFNYSVVRIFNGSFVAPNGKFYQGKASPKPVRKAYQPKYGSQKISKSETVKPQAKPVSPKRGTVKKTSPVEVQGLKPVVLDDFEIPIESVEPIDYWLTGTKAGGWTSTFMLYTNFCNSYYEAYKEYDSINEFSRDLAKRYKRVRRGSKSGFRLTLS